MAGATLGAGLAFLVARYLVRGRIEEFARKNRRFGAIDDAIGQEGWKIVGLLRLSPLIPFNVSNYFYGVTSIGFWPYLLASCVGILPGTLLYAYLGAIGQAGLEGGKKGYSPLQWTFLGTGLLATIAVTVFVSRVAKKALRKSGATKKIERYCVRRKPLEIGRAKYLFQRSLRPKTDECTNESAPRGSHAKAQRTRRKRQRLCWLAAHVLCEPL